MFLYIKKAPQKCGAVTKTQNIDMILAFFNVVASRQISPHIFNGGKDMEIIFSVQIINC